MPLTKDLKDDVNTQSINKQNFRLRIWPVVNPTKPTKPIKDIVTTVREKLVEIYQLSHSNTTEDFMKLVLISMKQENHYTWNQQNIQFIDLLMTTKEDLANHAFNSVIPTRPSENIDIKNPTHPDSLIVANCSNVIANMNLLGYHTTVLESIKILKDSFGKTPEVNESILTSTRFPD